MTVSVLLMSGAPFGSASVWANHSCALLAARSEVLAGGDASLRAANAPSGGAPNEPAHTERRSAVHPWGYWDYFVWRVNTTFRYLIAAWPIAFVLLSAVVLAGVWTRRRLRTMLSVRGVMQLVLPLFLFLGIVVLGMAYPWPWAFRTTQVLLAVQALAGLWLIRSASPCRVFAASLQGLLFWASFVAAIVAGEPGPFL
jgi:hypothetical protein